jgi:endonuclease YncB( thermonuclease family)
VSPAYTYRAVLERIIDADTFVLTIDLGFHVSTSKRVRLRGVNATEPRAPGGPEATAFLTDLIDGKPLIVESYKDRMSFERWICDVWVAGDEARAIRPRSVAEALIEAGHGVPAAA